MVNESTGWRLPVLVAGVLAIVVGLPLVLVLGLQATAPSAPSVGYGQFLDDVAAGHVERVDQQDQELTVTTHDGTYRVVVPTVLTDVLADVSAAAERGNRPAPAFTASKAPDMSWVGLIVSGVLPLVLIGGFILLLTRRAQRAQWPAARADVATRLREVDAARNEGLITDAERESARRVILEHV